MPDHDLTLRLFVALEAAGIHHNDLRANTVRSFQKRYPIASETAIVRAMKTRRDIATQLAATERGQHQ